MSYQTWLQQAISLLQQQRSDNPYIDPKRDAQVLLQAVTGKSSAYLLAFSETILSRQLEQELTDCLQRRLQGEPIAYILGEKEFWSLPLAVSPATLIPRPDTEVLVEKALQLAKLAISTLIDNQKNQYRILDLGTGTGAIILSLASELFPITKAKQIELALVAVDSQMPAVSLAQKNAQRLGIENITIMQSDWFSALNQQEKFDLIVSNPPYIDAQDPHLQLGDVRFEPRSALVAAQQGYADLSKIIQQAPNYLKQQGWLILEHGWQQAEGVQALFRQANSNLSGQQLQWQNIQSKQDYAGYPRISLAQLR
ncbi:protein-(glutamine-N5) methyltransferase, release factor-specific [Mergibacter septicus]|uniref:peptide chain release factor N(5)-glutamine methyltransferase n=1 Tax=Mergibacter septicus TaxID=221402 RepID=UPI0011793BCB|nr:peptide chain release factor N(5)-glutamine methyltransferase [Mergibacter septicus]AWX14601.1 protein-(glutamine-N5) methyltransferase, release factor-specific [Mergibacter septicus]